jgi:ubiquinone biosynthesis accessory factor UbiJ
MLDAMITAALNHLLQGEPWAGERLRAHAGSQALIRAGFVDVHLVIDAAGLFEVGAASQEAAVTISLPADTPFRLLGDRSSVFQAARLSGSADLAETLAFVFRNLRWDVEADLARLVGDIPARRLEMLRRTWLEQTKESTARAFGNLAEYACEDSDWLAPRRDIEAFARDVDALRDDLARLEKRLLRL